MANSFSIFFGLKKQNEVANDFLRMSMAVGVTVYRELFWLSGVLFSHRRRLISLVLNGSNYILGQNRIMNSPEKKK